MARKTTPDSNDSSLFREEMEGVKPLFNDKVSLRSSPPPARPLQHHSDRYEGTEELFSDGFEPADLELGDELRFIRPGVQQSLMRKLRRGHYPLDGELDLHGMTVATAKQALTHFLLGAREQGLRNLRIIHGKGLGSRHGQPVLKQKLNLWLRQRSEVLAFCSARPADGGTGAIYLLLKRG